MKEDYVEKEALAGSLNPSLRKFVMETDGISLNEGEVDALKLVRVRDLVQLYDDIAMGIPRDVALKKLIVKVEDQQLQQEKKKKVSKQASSDGDEQMLMKLKKAMSEENIDELKDLIKQTDEFKSINSDLESLLEEARATVEKVSSKRELISQLIALIHDAVITGNIEELKMAIHEAEETGFEDDPLVQTIAEAKDILEELGDVTIELDGVPAISVSSIKESLHAAISLGNLPSLQTVIEKALDIETDDEELLFAIEKAEKYLASKKEGQKKIAISISDKLNFLKLAMQKVILSEESIMQLKKAIDDADALDLDDADLILTINQARKLLSEKEKEMEKKNFISEKIALLKFSIQNIKDSKEGILSLKIAIEDAKETGDDDQELLNTLEEANKALREAELKVSKNEIISMRDRLNLMKITIHNLVKAEGCIADLKFAISEAEELKSDDEEMLKITSESKKLLSKKEEEISNMISVSDKIQILKVAIKKISEGNNGIYDLKQAIQMAEELDSDNVEMAEMIERAKLTLRDAEQNMTKISASEKVKLLKMAFHNATLSKNVAALKHSIIEYEDLQIDDEELLNVVSNARELVEKIESGKGDEKDDATKTNDQSNSMTVGRRRSMSIANKAKQLKLAIQNAVVSDDTFLLDQALNEAEELQIEDEEFVVTLEAARGVLKERMGIGGDMIDYQSRLEDNKGAEFEDVLYEEEEYDTPVKEETNINNEYFKKGRKKIPEHTYDISNMADTFFLKPRFDVVKYDPRSTIILSKKVRTWECDVLGHSMTNMSRSGKVRKVMNPENLVQLEKVPGNLKTLRMLFKGASHPYQLIFENNFERERCYEVFHAMRSSTFPWSPELCKEGESKCKTLLKGCASIIYKNGEKTSVSGSRTIHIASKPYEPISVFVGTWNMNKRLPPQDPRELRSFICPEKYDIYAIGIQESGFSLKQDHFNSYIQSVLGVNYMALASLMLWDIRIVVLVHKKHFLKVSNVEGDQKATGFLNMCGNRGGVGIGIKFNETNLLFINMHLASKTSNEQKGTNIDYSQIRNHNIGEIIDCMKMRNKELDILSQFHHVFICGGLNYKLDIEYERAQQMIGMGSYEELIDYDQLRNTMKQGKILRAWQEGKIKFPPTQIFNKKRKDRVKKPPSYTDRVVWKSLPGTLIALQEYRSVDIDVGSDHFPVLATFKLNTLRPYLSIFSKSEPKLVLVMETAKVKNLKASVDAAYLYFYGEFFNRPETTHKLGKTKELTWGKQSLPKLRPTTWNIEYLKTQFISVALKNGKYRSDHPDSIVGSCVLPLKALLQEPAALNQFKTVTLLGTKRTVAFFTLELRICLSTNT